MSQPYFASITNDYNVAWDSVDENNRGILELPVSLGNISAYGFASRKRS